MSNADTASRSAVSLLGRIRRSATLWLAELLFPRECVGCGRNGSFLCDTCRSAIRRKVNHDCPFCREVDTPFGVVCPSCATRHSLDALYAAMPFRGNPVVEEAVHVLKYEFVTELAEPLGGLLAESVAATDLSLPDAIVPVPLHPWRVRFRGFNQSSLLAEILAKNVTPELPIPIRGDILRRVRFTLPQARSHDAQERRTNLSGAFALRKESSLRKEVKGKIFWLVDDVATTGATLEECARVLKKAGAKKVFGIVLAR